VRDVKPFFKVVSPAEASSLLAAVAPVGRERIKTVRAKGRVLAEDIHSPVDLPHFHRAAMDGYAVRAKDTFGASASQPAYLKVVGTVEMGKAATAPLGEGEAVRISTGGMLPPGADAVVMVEYTEEVGEQVEVQRAVSPWGNVIRIGDDIEKGALVFRAGRRLRAHDLGALTGIGVAEVAVHLRPRVALISTGDEIVPPEEEPGPGQVRNINQHALAAMVEDCGAELEDLGLVRDDRSALIAALRRGLEGCDAVLLSGGSSVGIKDMVSESILSLPGAEVVFHGISVSPGKPTLYARAMGKPVLGLPGYPVSALVIFELFAAPFLRRLGGETETAGRFRRTARAILKTNVASQPGREDYIRVVLEEADGRLYAQPLPSKSGAIFTLVKADGMIRVELGREGIEQGEEVEVILFS
jgi:molybdopterin molybdotransferase